METKIAIVLAINTAAFLGYLALSIFILVRLHFRLDTVSLISISAVLLVLLCNFVDWLVFVLMGYGEPGVFPTHTTAAIFIILNAFGSTLFHIIGYFFCFEMRFVHEQIKSSSYDEFVSRQAKVKRLRDLFLILALAMQIMFLGLIYKRYYLLSPEDHLGTPFYVAYMVQELIKVIMDIYILKIMF